MLMLPMVMMLNCNPLSVVGAKLNQSRVELRVQTLNVLFSALESHPTPVLSCSLPSPGALKL